MIDYIHYILVVFYTVKTAYICVFMTCSTSYSLCDEHMDQCNVCMYVFFFLVLSLLHYIV